MPTILEETKQWEAIHGTGYQLELLCLVKGGTEKREQRRAIHCKRAHALLVVRWRPSHGPLPPQITAQQGFVYGGHDKGPCIYTQMSNTLEWPWADSPELPTFNQSRVFYPCDCRSL